MRIICACLLLAASVAFGETAAFEVASIKPAGPPDPAKMMSGQMRIGITIDQGRVDIGFFSLADLIRTAYKVKPYQITGPPWMSTERFEIHAKLPEGGTKEQVPEMLQTLLADRFKLTIHRDNKEQNTYALVVAKGGHKLKDSLPDVEAPPAEDAKGSAGGITVGTPDGQMRMKPTANGMTMTGGPGGPVKMTMGPAGMHMEAAKMTMTAFAEMLTPFVDRPVVDMTALKGTYQVALDLSMEDMRSVARMAGVMGPGGPGGAEPPKAAPADAATDPTGGSIFSTVQQLGLKLEARKAAIEHIVVDHLEKAPTDN